MLIIISSVFVSCFCIVLFYIRNVMFFQKVAL